MSIHKEGYPGFEAWEAGVRSDATPRITPIPLRG
jgi:hypothetical protein